MFDDNNNADDNSGGCIMGGSIADVRDRALRIFAHHVRCVQDNKPNLPGMYTLKDLPEIDDSQRVFLGVDETEAIIAEHAAPNAEKFPSGVYAIGGESKEAFEQSMRKLFEALCRRIESNVTRKAVELGYLECAFDSEENNFVFSPTEKGVALAQDFDKARPDAHAPSDN